jgi:hypothetical protein
LFFFILLVLFVCLLVGFFHVGINRVIHELYVIQINSIQCYTWYEVNDRQMVIRWKHVVHKTYDRSNGITCTYISVSNFTKLLVVLWCYKCIWMKLTIV